MTKDFYTALKERRTYYGINKEVQVSDEKIKEIVEFAVKYTPSAFNSQTARLVVLFGEAHNKLWDITTETLRKVVGDGDFSGTQQKWILLKLVMEQYYSLKMKLLLNRFKKNLLHMLKTSQFGHTKHQVCTN